MILIDTSVWVDFLRSVDNGIVAKLWDFLSEEADLCSTGIITAEILAGQKSATLRRKIQRDLDGLIRLPAEDPADFIAAADIYLKCRESGITPRGLIDCLIVAIAVRHNAELFHKDRDFEAMKEVVPRLRTITG